MSGPFNKHFYNGTQELYLALFSTIMAELKIDTERGLMQVPLATAIGRRNNLNRQQGSNTLPFATIMYGSSFEIDKSVTTNRNNQLVTPTARSANRLPVIFPMTYNVRCKKYGEMMQIVEQIYAAFYPSLDCRIRDSQSLQHEQGVHFKITGHNIDDNWEGEGVEPQHIDAEFTFEFHGYLYGRDFWTKGEGSDVDPTLIKEVIIELGQDMQMHWSDLPEWFRVDKDGVHHPEDSK
ncbi:proximal tail sheath stabilization protein [Erwinia phage vB_EamM-Bue1]|uniref:Proximal tail sheath stabilization protein n=1 Tax=Erwinia phage vB_EamM-Bue1 TaxID=2099338 RepID=A0A2P1JUF2_9CAUD|nr:proximal tail sheath stabilization protein [Erwinia phage vB_EamM-Bue1]AVO22977.1 proximal tail sheath stabilization protein [Erwinia phage vB_EamM-Bue1]